MSALNSILAPVLLRAVGFTLLHSLWQGALVAVAATALFRRQRAVVRYRIAGTALGLVMALTVCTFGAYYTTGLGPRAAQQRAWQAGLAPTAGQLKAGSLASFPTAVGQVAPAATWAAAWLAGGAGAIERHLPLVVGAWLLGMAAMTLRLLGGLLYVQRLRRVRVAAVPQAWQDRLDILVERAGLQQRVQLLASAVASSPVVVGLLRPVILVPVEVLTGMSMPELEMILAHEVAHVLRKDYLINLLQSIVEIIFFYHPAVWFLSARLRDERESCCDERATALCGNAHLLARALSSLAELTYAAAQPRLAVAASGPAGSLLWRIRHLLLHRPAPPTFIDGVGAACVALASACLLVSSTVLSVAATAPVSGAAATSGVLSKPGFVSQVPAPRARFDFDQELQRDGLIRNPQHYEYTLTAAMLLVDGKVQAPAVFAKYRRLYEAETGKKLGPNSTYHAKRDEKTERKVANAPASPQIPAAPTDAPQPRKAAPTTPPSPNDVLVLAMLKKDGLVDPAAKSFQLALTAEGLTVNGRRCSEAQAAAYRRLLGVPQNQTGAAQTAVHMNVKETVQINVQE